MCNQLWYAEHGEKINSQSLLNTRMRHKITTGFTSFDNMGLLFPIFVGEGLLLLPEVFGSRDLLGGNLLAGVVACSLSAFLGGRQEA